jgi:hypothetical protein
MIQNIVFYNRWHNGDVFLAKGYMIRLINRLKQSNREFNFYSAHVNSPKLLLDLDATHINLNEKSIPAQDHHTVLVVDDTIYINTWVGAYKKFFNQQQHHSNLVTISYIWVSIYYTLQTLLDIRLFGDYEHDKFSPIDGVPTTIWQNYDIEPVKDFVVDKDNLILFCNGRVRSAQTRYSNIGLMSESIIALAAENPNYNFVCTEKFINHLNLNNIFFTDDIFANVRGGDINEIAYLSTFCDVIVGKSSGPHMYCHVKENLDRDCIFFTVGDRQSDDYLYNLYDHLCTSMFFVGKQEQQMVNVLHQVINKKTNYFKHNLITDEQIIELRKTVDARNY